MNGIATILDLQSRARRNALSASRALRIRRELRVEAERALAEAAAPSVRAALPAPRAAARSRLQVHAPDPVEPPALVRTRSISPEVARRQSS